MENKGCSITLPPFYVSTSRRETAFFFGSVKLSYDWKTSPAKSCARSLRGAEGLDLWKFSMISREFAQLASGSQVL